MGLMVMSYLPDTLPFPDATSKEEDDFWDFCRGKRLAFRNCMSCGHVHNPPLCICPKCQSTNLGWQKASEEVFLYTYTVVHHVVHDAVLAYVPYVVGVVRFPDMNDLRFVSNIVGIDTQDVKIEMPLSLIWEAYGKDMYLPRFTTEALV